TTADNVLGSMANLLPIDLLFRKVLMRVVLQLASLPPTHLLHNLVKTVAGRFVHRHCSSLHNLFHYTGIDPNTMEEVSPTRCSHSYKPAFSTYILELKSEVLDKIEAVFDRSHTVVFCDGSGYEGGIGASAVLFVDEKEKSNLKYHLGSSTEHTVYEAKIVGICLGLHALQNLNRQLQGQTICGSDSQVMLKALNNQKPHLAHYLLDKVHSMAEHIHKKQDRLLNVPQRCTAIDMGTEWSPHTKEVILLQLHWSPGHKGFIPNKWADQLAKEAASGESSLQSVLPAFLHQKTLPISIPAWQQAELTVTQVI
ncbi:hypothetical protein J132_05972, partial [Termitomyces sp. J132]